MGHCPGCGGHVRSPVESWGHIIGCGGFNTPENRVIPWGRQEVRLIVERAFRAANIEVKKADAFAAALKQVLDERFEKGERGT